MIARLGRFGSAVIVLIVIQTLILGWMVVERVMILKSPNVITLKSEPVDPRDLFRGDYVTLGYAITTLPLTAINGDMKWKNGETIFVELAPTKDDWQAIAAFHNNTTPTVGNKIIRGKIDYLDETHNIAHVNYGIERYYVPEGEGRTLEDQRNKRALSVEVVLAGDGEAAIKGIRLDGKPVYQEPLF